MKKIAILIVNYNMPERADGLFRNIACHVRWPHDVCLIDNGSDSQEPSQYTSVRLEKNVQTTGGWLAGLKWLDQHGEDYLAYAFLITSARVPDEQGDIFSGMAQFLTDNPDAVGIHPSLTHDSTTGWPHLINRGTNAPRRTWMIDNICSMYRTNWFNSIGRFDPEMSFAWGIDLETCYRARKQGRSIWIDDRVQVEKITNIGYTMNRMNMSADERGKRAHANMSAVLGRKYGPAWWEKMTQEGVLNEWK